MIETIAEKLIYENAFAKVFDDDVRFPDGSSGTYFRSEWKAPHGVAIVPLIGSDILLIRHFRYTEQCEVVEIPQGFGTYGTLPENDARRELREETGCTATAIQPLMQIGHRFVTHVFIARVKESAVPTAMAAEHSEAVAGFVRLPIAALTPTGIIACGIRDAVSIAALLYARDSRYDNFGRE